MREQYLRLLRQHLLLMQNSEFNLAKLHPEDYVYIVKSCVNSNEYSDFYCNLLHNAIHYAQAENSQKDCAQILASIISTVESSTIISEDALISFFNLHNTVQTNYYTLFSHQSYEKNAPKNRIGSCPFKGKGVIYTVITGDYDSLREPTYVDEALDYILLTDNPNIVSNFWSIRLIDNPDKLSSIKLARKNKILCHEILPEYDFSIYVDGKVHIIGDLNELISKYSLGRGMLCFPHFSRSNISEEFSELSALQKDNIGVMSTQVNRYYNSGFPKDYPLTDTCILIRDHHNEQLISAMNTWWQEVNSNSFRDQLSFGYSCWKNQFEYDLCDLFCGDNPYAVAGGHNS